MGGTTMRAWLLQGEQGGETDALYGVLRQWTARPENSAWSIECLRWGPELTAAKQVSQPDLLVLADVCPVGPWTDELPAQGAAVVVATRLERAGIYRRLVECYPLHLTPLPVSLEGLGLAILSALASAQRQRAWQTRVDQLQQRLTDRIVIERAKGILVQRLGITEKEAYKRLRVLSRRQRRQIRDIAQSLLDTQSLLNPDMNGFAEGPHHDEHPPFDRLGSTS
jgi:response regulator NasT